MLRLIYPSEKTPIVTSFDMFIWYLEAAHKYDLGGMLGTLDDQVSVNINSKSLIRQDHTSLPSGLVYPIPKQ